MYKYSYYSSKLLDGFIYCFKDRIQNIQKANTGSIYFIIKNSNRCGKKDHGVRFRISSHWTKELKHKTFYITIYKDECFCVVVTGKPNQILYKDKINLDEKLLITKLYNVYHKYRRKICIGLNEGK